eukprot:CAMPEP_0178379152 /NCGR_PEP_ID=MMETSP0689_2-20121128/4793_1 /TAXON_ID=160604 /ORGANISM="Amphidinium massartii, Strain CS-259" /LENGTH=361 /DNA_ID=CAMNT_0019999241 /DNA_START=40 /DNA_END=1122 /DNA_ORIENTATION=-
MIQSGAVAVLKASDPKKVMFGISADVAAAADAAAGPSSPVPPEAGAVGGPHGAYNSALDPFLLSTVPRSQAPGASAGPENEARVLAELYRRMVEGIEAVQLQLETDQEHLALMIQQAQHRCATLPIGLCWEEEDQVTLFRDGLELRLREFEEACRRLASLERRLQRKLDEAEAACELEAITATGLVDPRLIDKLVEQRRVIRLQQEELEHVYFERDCLRDDAERLRETCLLQAAHLTGERGDEGFDVMEPTLWSPLVLPDAGPDGAAAQQPPSPSACGGGIRIGSPGASAVQPLTTSVPWASVSAGSPSSPSAALPSAGRGIMIGGPAVQPAVHPELVDPQRSVAGAESLSAAEPAPEPTG